MYVFRGISCVNKNNFNLVITKYSKIKNEDKIKTRICKRMNTRTININLVSGYKYPTPDLRLAFFHPLVGFFAGRFAAGCFSRKRVAACEPLASK